MDPVTAFLQAAGEQSVLILGMGALLWLAGRWFKRQEDRKNIQEDAREKRYNDLIDSTLSMSRDNVKVLSDVVGNNTAAWQRVEAKLNEKPH